LPYGILQKSKKTEGLSHIGSSAGLYPKQAPDTHPENNNPIL